jgi:tetratricopeptide (TPR) repeat protein
VWESDLMLWRCAVERQPSAAMTHARLGDALAAVDLDDGAEASYQRGLVATSPDRDRVAFHYAGFLRRRGRFGEAESWYHQAARHSSTRRVYHLELGELYLEERRFAEAEAALGRALAIEPSGRACVALGITALRQERFAEAIAWFEQATRRHRANPLPYFYLAELHDRLTPPDPERAQRWRAAGLALLARDHRPALARRYDARGIAYAVAGRPEAVAMFKQAIRYDGGCAKPYLALARLYLEREPPQTALARRRVEEAERLGASVDPSLLAQLELAVGLGAAQP